jgi:tRNA1(Val) A37 N6-methylase TrmN6
VAALEEDNVMREAGTAAAEPGALDRMRLEATRRLNPERKAELGQFMTPESVARFMAGLFSQRTGAIRLLDAGAGVGSLTAAFLNRWGSDEVRVTVYEIDGTLARYLRETLRAYADGRFEATVIDRDFIRDAVYKITMGGRGAGFTHAILNPPYRKINSASQHRALLRAIRLETVNLYTAFVGLAIELMAQGGEIVAIVPRSFCNGLYYKPFREWVFAKASIEHIHLFHSRTSAFNDDDVLQENVIIKLVRGKKQGRITITTASDTGFSDIEAHDYPFSEIVPEGDEQRFIHVPVAPSQGGLDGVPLAGRALEELGLEVSTGPVVDFRLKDFLRKSPDEKTAPLLYPAHFASGGLEWPRRSKKPNAVIDNLETRKWLYPKGFYTIVRRFSSKEERRRIVAHVVDPAAFKGDMIGFENHLNVFHSGKRGITADVARGLAVFLNSTSVDAYFRRFSGHTQVNATDLRFLRYPELLELEEMGRWVQAQESLTQESIDHRVAALNGKRK